MSRPEGTTLVCECCELDVSERLSSPVVNAHGLNRGWRCRLCNEHQGKPLEMAQHHEYEVRVRWGETIDELHAAEDRADEYREKMNAAYRSRDAMLVRFDKIGRYHRPTLSGGCICGKHRCETLAIINGDSISGHIGGMYRRGEMG
jgi:hypothetical protein